MSDDLRRVMKFRDALPKSSQGWFDGLSEDDQKRVARAAPTPPSDFQRDYDAADPHGYRDGAYES